jgi:hypothetical protein
VLPESWSSKFAELADDFDSYVAISAGLNITKSDTMTIDGVEVKVIVKATLNEISILGKEPAIKSTYARFVSSDSCNDIEDDYERLRLVGRYISLHRAAKAAENGGVVKYAHATSPWERAADRFERALRNLA